MANENTTAENLPTMDKVKHPCRCSILGTKHLIADLKLLIQKREDISDELKSVILAEIDSKKSNAAQVDMHVVDHTNGDSSIHIHVKNIDLG